MRSLYEVFETNGAGISQILHAQRMEQVIQRIFELRLRCLTVVNGGGGGGIRREREESNRWLLLERDALNSH